jgi:hypothetical protein
LETSCSPCCWLPGTTYGITTGSSYEFSHTDYTWPLIRAAAGRRLPRGSAAQAPRRGGFNYPGMQMIGVEGVYLFRTGARSSPSKLAGTPESPVTTNRRPDCRPTSGARPASVVLGRARRSDPHVVDTESMGRILPGPGRRFTGCDGRPGRSYRDHAGSAAWSRVRVLVRPEVIDAVLVHARGMGDVAQHSHQSAIPGRSHYAGAD